MGARRVALPFASERPWSLCTTGVPAQRPAASAAKPSSDVSGVCRLRSLKTEERTKKPVRAIALWPSHVVIAVNSINLQTGRPPVTPVSRAAVVSAPVGVVHQHAPALRSKLVLISPLGSGGRGPGEDLDGEFDPGSGRTLAACLIHASRTRLSSVVIPLIV